MMAEVANFYVNLYANIANWCAKKMQSMSKHPKISPVNTQEKEIMIFEKCPFTHQEIAPIK